MSWMRGSGLVVVHLCRMLECEIVGGAELTIRVLDRSVISFCVYEVGLQSSLGCSILAAIACVSISPDRLCPVAIMLSEAGLTASLHWLHFRPFC